LKNVTDVVNNRKYSIQWEPVNPEPEIGIRKLPDYSPGGKYFHYAAEYSNAAMKNHENLMRELNLKINGNKNE